ncbi:peptidase S8/S53 domain-containing protein [Paraphysoderma sedebokerense]|nr:peptidase S8/S53 domain-containing protein [Paraphysoderma sedebokerense]
MTLRFSPQTGSSVTLENFLNLANSYCTDNQLDAILKFIKFDKHLDFINITSTNISPLGLKLLSQKLHFDKVQSVSKFSFADYHRPNCVFQEEEPIHDLRANQDCKLLGSAASDCSWTGKEAASWIVEFLSSEFFRDSLISLNLSGAKFKLNHEIRWWQGLHEVFPHLKYLGVGYPLDFNAQKELWTVIRGLNELDALEMCVPRSEVSAVSEMLESFNRPVIWNTSSEFSNLEVSGESTFNPIQIQSQWDFLYKAYNPGVVDFPYDISTPPLPDLSNSTYPTRTQVIRTASSIPDSSSLVDYQGIQKLNPSLPKPKNIKVAILDSGIDLSHPFFDCRKISGKSFVPLQHYLIDRVGHGTHCAGLVLQVASEAELLIGKVLPDDGSKADTAWVTEGIKWAIEEEADIISLSLGSPTGTYEQWEAIQVALMQGIMVIAAATNDGERQEGSIGYPAKYGNVICVGSHDENGNRSIFSSAGRELDFLAPGENVWSTCSMHISIPNGHKVGYSLCTGTSMATPIVSGVAALLLAYDRENSHNRIRNLAQLRSILISMCTSSKEHSSQCGYGILKPAEFFRNLTELGTGFMYRNLTC